MPNRTLRGWRCAATAALALVTAVAEAGGLRLAMEAGLSHDSNINRAASAQALSDLFASLEGSAARSVVTGSHSGLVARFALRGQGHRDFSDLDAIAAAGRIAWRYQPDLRFTTPWFEVVSTAEVRRHRDSAIRDGELVSLGVGAGKYFTDRIRVSGGASVDRRFAREGEVYELKQRRLFASLDWRLGPSLTAYGSATWIGGHQVFTWSPAAGGTAVQPYRYQGEYDWYAASARDPAFDGSGRAFSAYRAEATARVLDAGLNYAFDGQTAVDVSATWFDAEADRGPGYSGVTVRLLLIHRFP